ncbi:MAG: T9SS type A sorting domain-containing protein [Bacteroidales bacterium]|nr:T9SS type A sorting domain-containing protein [Bacteroidales bacterium]
MKTKIITLTVLALMMGLSLNTKAENEDTAKVDQAAPESAFKASINLYPDNVVKFLIEKPDQDIVKLRVYDVSGVELFNYAIRKENVARIGFDVSNLKPGNYEYAIERNKQEVMRKTIKKAN